MYKVRLTREYRAILKDPVPYVEAHPSQNDLLVWHYCITGPADSPYYLGRYFGSLIFPGEYPMKPPSIMIHTPNGRFKPDTRLCFSMSDFHPETWNPMWSVSSILTGLLSFMLEEAQTYGSIEASTEDRKALAAASHAFNNNHRVFKKEFPHLVNTVPEPETPAKKPNSSDSAQTTTTTSTTQMTPPEPPVDTPPVVATQPEPHPTNETPIHPQMHKEELPQAEPHQEPQPHPQPQPQPQPNKPKANKKKGRRRR
ncbi:Ubiquitinconjugating enzyme subfamily protein [Pelomyxa schiedti]|nr:Ubiquitinconjugating enzyme subfamily protein [Pelomyxa schiedti]